MHSIYENLLHSGPNKNYIIVLTQRGLLLPGVDRVEFSLEELENECEEITVKL